MLTDEQLAECYAANCVDRQGTLYTGLHNRPMIAEAHANALRAIERLAARADVPRIDLKELKDLLEVCSSCDLIYQAHFHGGYGLGTEVFGVKIDEGTDVNDIVKAVIKLLDNS